MRQQTDHVCLEYVHAVSFFFQLPKGRSTGGKVVNSSSDKRIALNLMAILKCLCMVFKHQIEKR